MKLLLENVTKTFDNKTIIDDATFSFEKGKIYGLLGRNGAGKPLYLIVSREICS